MIGRPVRPVKPGSRWRHVLLGAAVAGVLAGTPAHACDCRRLPEPSAALPIEAPVIFAGRVVEIRERSERLVITRDGSAETSVRTLERTVVFRVTRAWRGVATPTFTVATDWSDCAYPFSAGAEYLVFADATAGPHPSTSICTRTTPLERAAPLLERLGAGR
jgi:hypothetical protein